MEGLMGHPPRDVKGLEPKNGYLKKRDPSHWIPIKNYSQKKIEIRKSSTQWQILTN
jgi:hypothetical protein